MRLLRTVPSRAGPACAGVIVYPSSSWSNRVSCSLRSPSTAPPTTLRRQGIAPCRSSTTLNRHDRRLLRTRLSSTFAIGPPTITLAVGACRRSQFRCSSMVASQPGYSGTPLIQIDGHGVPGVWLWPDPQPRFRLQRESGDWISTALAGRRGTHQYGASYNTFQSCNFSSNGVRWRWHMSDAGSNTVTGCTFSGNSVRRGIHVRCRLQHLHQLHLLRKLERHGVSMSGADSNTFQSCNFSSNDGRDGVVMSMSAATPFTAAPSPGTRSRGIHGKCRLNRPHPVAVAPSPELTASGYDISDASSCTTCHPAAHFTR